MAQHDSWRHSPRLYDELGTNWSSTTLLVRSHHRASSSVRTASPEPNIASCSDEEPLCERGPTSTPEPQLGSRVPATEPGHDAFIAGADPGNTVDANVG